MDIQNTFQWVLEILNTPIKYENITKFTPSSHYTNFHILFGKLQVLVTGMIAFTFDRKGNK